MTTMPAEWEPHDRTWMAFPPDTETSSDLDAEGLAEVRLGWAAVAAAIVDYEPVTMVVRADDEEAARAVLDPRVDLHIADLDDAWMRDMGPTFVHDVDGSVAAIDWIFNGWGAQEWASWENDSLIGRIVARSAGAVVLDSPMVNEGGGIHVDGVGTVLVTETVQLDPGRNPTWSKPDVEAELIRTLGVEKIVWLRRGLTRDYEPLGTRGHVDIVACFSDTNTLLVHDQRNPEHPDHEVTAEVVEILEDAGDWNIVRVPAPQTIVNDEGWVDWSYINHYVCNGAVILCAFDDPNDDVAADILRSAYPGREIVLVDARVIFSRGGGIHCITQQQPSPRL